jgi:hypothetical protein
MPGKVGAEHLEAVSQNKPGMADKLDPLKEKLGEMTKLSVVIKNTVEAKKIKVEKLVHPVAKTFEESEKIKPTEFCLDEEEDDHVMKLVDLYGEIDSISKTKLFQEIELDQVLAEEHHIESDKKYNPLPSQSKAVESVSEEQKEQIELALTKTAKAIIGEKDFHEIAEKSPELRELLKENLESMITQQGSQDLLGQLKKEKRYSIDEIKSMVYGLIIAYIAKHDLLNEFLERFIEVKKQKSIGLVQTKKEKAGEEIPIIFKTDRDGAVEVLSSDNFSKISSALEAVTGETRAEERRNDQASKILEAIKSGK